MKKKLKKKENKKKKIKFKKRRIRKGKAINKFNIILKLICKVIIIILLSLLLFQIKFTNISTIKVGLCVVCKDENLYIKEFIEHYKNLGYNHIFIYDNNDIDGEKLEDIIQKEIDEGFISIINYRGNNKKPQMKIYIDCYRKNKKNYDWLSFFDVDEFLEIMPKGIKIQNFLGNKRYKYCENIKVHWVLYSDDDKLYYENKPVQERFKTALFNHSLNSYAKLIVRGNLSTNFWKGAIEPHFGVQNYNCCSLSGKEYHKAPKTKIPYDYEYGYLKHYRTKTVEEYIKKIKKGRVNNKRIKNKDMIQLFFENNKKTKEKIDIFKKELNIY